MDLKTRVQNRLIAEMDPSMDVSQTAEVRATIKGMYEAILQEESIILGRKERDTLFEGIVAEILGLGPLERLIAEDDITEIMVNGPKQIYVERKGKLQRVNLAFESDEHLMRIIERIVAPLGRRIDESSPTVDARLKDQTDLMLDRERRHIDRPGHDLRRHRFVAFDHGNRLGEYRASRRHRKGEEKRQCSQAIYPSYNRNQSKAANNQFLLRKATLKTCA